MLILVGDLGMIETYVTMVDHRGKKEHMVDHKGKSLSLSSFITGQMRYDYTSQYEL